MKTTIEEMSKLGKGTTKWFDAAFEDCTVSKEVQQAARKICHAYGIWGQSDPAYIANVIQSCLTK